MKASEKNMNSRFVYGYGLEHIEQSPCQQQDGESPGPIKIDRIEIKGDSLISVNLKIWANCAYSFLGEIEIDSTNTLNLIYHGYGGYAMCGCCFGLIYHIKLYHDEDKDLTKVKEVMINGDRRTKTTIDW